MFEFLNEEYSFAELFSGKKAHFLKGGVITDTIAFKKWFGKSKVVDDNGKPLKVYHGTTHAWTEYSPDRGNPDNFFGVGFYASSDKGDVEINYKGIGKDLTGRINMLADKIADEQNIDYEKAKNIAKRKLAGKEPKILEVYLSIHNPLILTDTWRGTNFEFTPTEDEETGDWVESEDKERIYNIIRTLIYGKYSEYNLDIQRVTESLGDIDEIKANDLVRIFRENEYLLDWLCCDEKTGRSLMLNFIRDIFIEMGFDGVIDEIPNKRFPRMDIPEGAKHYIVWNPTQIKLADGTNTDFDGSSPDIRYGKGGLIAPNGKKSNLTPEQYKLVRTPEFKKWFGDWENDAKNSSKVVDENGEPLVVYHGSHNEFNIFDKNRAGELETIEGVDRKIGIYFSNKKSIARFFTKNKGSILEVFLKIKTPLKASKKELSTFEINFFKETGNDGIIWNRGSGMYVNNNPIPLPKGEKSEIEYIVFNSNQIKLADGTNTTFDGSNPDIRYEKGGVIYYGIDIIEKNKEFPANSGTSDDGSSFIKDDDKFVLKEINPRQVLSYPSCTRESYADLNMYEDLITIDELIGKIKKGIELNPIIVDSNYQLIDGNHRLVAYNKLKTHKIKAYVKVNPDIRYEKGGELKSNTFEELSQNMDLNELIGIANKYSKQSNVEINISDIKPISYNGETIADAIKNVKKGNKSHSKDNPEVSFYKGKYNIIDGHHRIAESIIRGDNKIKVDILSITPKLLSQEYRSLKSKGINNELTDELEYLIQNSKFAKGGEIITPDNPDIRYEKGGDVKKKVVTMLWNMLAGETPLQSPDNLKLFYDYFDGKIPDKFKYEGMVYRYFGFRHKEIYERVLKNGFSAWETQKYYSTSKSLKAIDEVITGTWKKRYKYFVIFKFKVGKDDVLFDMNKVLDYFNIEEDRYRKEEEVLVLAEKIPSVSKDKIVKSGLLLDYTETRYEKGGEITTPDQQLITPERAVLKVMKILYLDGHKALIVGGAVRDALLGIEPKDIDIEVYNITFKELGKLLWKFGEVNFVGKEFGVIKFKPRWSDTGLEYDFSVPRKENRIGVGHKDFKVTFDKDMTIAEAGARRDFTFNALAYDPIKNKIYDYFGGLEDLQNGVIRHTSDAFREDFLRILRAMQFQARFGFSIHPDTIQVIREMLQTNDFNELSKERVYEEWMKWASKGVRHDLIFKFLWDTTLMNYYPELSEFKTTEQDKIYHPEGDVEIHTAMTLQEMDKLLERDNIVGNEKALLVMSILLHDVAKPQTTKEEMKRDRLTITSKGHEALGGEMSKEFLSRLGFPDSFYNPIANLVANHLAGVNISMIPEREGKLKAVKKLSRRLHPATIKQLIYVMDADNLGRGTAKKEATGKVELLELSTEADVMEKQNKPILMGRHLIELGLKPSLEFSEILRKSFVAQENGEFNDLEGGMKWLKEYLK